MNLEHEDSDWLKQEIRQRFAKHVDPSAYRFFFFGSRVRGDNFPRADIDLGIQGEESLPAETKVTLEEELDKIPILYKIDLVDFCNVNDRFKREALKNLELI